MLIQDRAKKILSLDNYSQSNYVAPISRLILDPPHFRKSILRMPIQEYDGAILLPSEFNWCKPLIRMAYDSQKHFIGVSHPFVYLTIRHGVGWKDTTDWHVDGFSMRFNHLPGQNYIWCNKYPTQFASVRGDFPTDFDPMEHNIHKFLSNRITDFWDSSPQMLYCIDPYILHRTPDIWPQLAKDRIFVRVSFVPIEIRDINNTQNPYIPKHHLGDGVADFRNTLKEY